MPSLRKPFKPRGPQAGGRKKLPPVGGARRTGSVELTRHLAELKDNFRLNLSMELPEPIQAELRAIQERNLAGTWTKRDLARVKQIRAQFVQNRKH